MDVVCQTIAKQENARERNRRAHTARRAPAFYSAREQTDAEMGYEYEGKFEIKHVVSM